MKKINDFYFTKMIALGAIVALFLGTFILGKQFMFNVFSLNSNSGLIQITLGSPPILFETWVITGSAISYLCHTTFFEASKNFSFWPEFKPWFVAPFYWLTLIGFPCSIIVGFFYRILSKLFHSIKTAQRPPFSGIL